MAWKPGDRLIHRFNRDLGTGIVAALDGRSVVVSFPRTGDALRLAADSDALEPLVFEPGARARLGPDGDSVTVASVADGERVKLTDGRIVEIETLWPLELDDSLVERLAHGETDALEDFALRLDALTLAAKREADGLGSFLGGRIHLYPHQLHVAERATRADPVRWLLADEVGLGKTVEACLILNHLSQTGRADRTLVVAPETLTVQWLGELWRKYHQVFVLLDDRRLVDVEREYGPGFNPFDAHRRVVVAMEMLVDNPWLGDRAIEAGIDLLIVDEAHHLRRPAGHPGNAEYRAIRPLADQGRHVLLLSATPLEDDAHGFFRLLQLLRPDEFPEDASFEERLRAREPLPPCTSSTRRDDIGGLPPRAPQPVELADGAAFRERLALQAVLRAADEPHRLARRRKLDLLQAALAGDEVLAARLERGDGELKGRLELLEHADPRVDWLNRHARRWRDAGDKTLVFVARRESLELLRTALRRGAQIRTGVFHEDLSPSQRDIEVAQFRLDSGPSMLISTECGGEGRNFEFCTRMVLFDLPWDPMVVEQRIGRLDRIGRRIPVEIVYFRLPAGLGATVAALYERLGLFERPLGSFERELAGAQEAIERAALSDEETPGSEWFDALVGTAEQAWSRVREAAYHELHREPYHAGLAEKILARIPHELDELNEDVVLQACERLGLDVEPQRGEGRYAITLGNRARVDSLPGVPGGSSYLGTFEREHAVEDETIDYFAAGHPLVEGLLTHLDETPLGRVGLLRARGRGEQGVGLLALYKRGAEFEAVAVDAAGSPRPDWAALLARRPLRSRRVDADAWVRRPEWGGLVRSMAGALPSERGAPAALALFHLDD